MPVLLRVSKWLKFEWSNALAMMAWLTDVFAGSESILHIPVVQLCTVVRRRVLLLCFLHHCRLVYFACLPDLPDSLGDGSMSVVFSQSCNCCSVEILFDWSYFLGRLFDRVDLIKPVSMSMRTYLRTSARPQKVSLISMKFGVWVEVDDWCTTVCSMTRSKVKVMSPPTLEIWPFTTANASAIYNGSWQLTMDS